MRTGQGGTTCDDGEPAPPARKHRRPSVPRSGVLVGVLHAWCTRRERPAGPQRGSVTAEVAVVLPALVVLLALLLATAHVGTVQLRLEEAARAGAREVMRGESSASVQQTVQRLAGDNATAQVGSAGDWTTIEVRARVEGPLVDLLDLELHASAAGRKEHDG
ncbi:TadE family type IV pilus minor pilin [Arthrobacter sp. SX1312]|uniref:TadE family type IV pilus minor pilin n=1 Tax=Arthrobacter sp. SX1312 TaxID=2058896 RepID=UPI000CE4FD3C|nr:TadE family type IV pilus minor pilin [Arthrobacter sp. SX1312]